MSIRITRTVSPHPGAGRAPIEGDASVVDDDPALVFVRIYRAAYAIAETYEPGVIDAGIYPYPDVRPWSARGITPSPKSLASPQVQHYAHVYENACSRQAWELKLTGSRYRITFDTLDAAFSIAWTLEFV